MKKNQYYKKFMCYIYPYFSKYAIGLIIMFINIVLSIIQPYFTAKIIDNIIILNDIKRLNFYIIIMIALMIFSSFFSLLQTYLYAKLGNKVTLDIKKDIFFKIQTLHINNFNKNRIGDLMLRVSSDADTLQNILCNIIPQVLVDSLMIIGVILVMFKININITIIILLAIFLTVFNLYYFGPKVKKKSIQIRKKMGDITSFIQDILVNILLIKAYKREEYNKNKFAYAYEKLNEFKLKITLLVTTISLGNNFIFFLGNIGTIWLCTNYILTGKMNIGDLVALTAYNSKAFSTILKLAQTNLNFEQAKASINRLIEILEYKGEFTGGKNITIYGNIEFKNVSFSYQEKIPVLNKVNLKINSGEKILIFGNSGIGKSTLVKLLLGFYEDYSGLIYIDGVELRQIAIKSLRSQISIVLQENYLLYDTIENNITLGEQYTYQEINKVIAIAEMVDEIKALTNKYDTVVCENGKNLSLGQRQRLTLCRAIIRKPKILILDEATSGVSTDIERKILNNIIKEFPNMTILMISHRRELLHFFEKKYKLEP